MEKSSCNRPWQKEKPMQYFRIKSSDIKTWRFGDDMSPLSNANYNKIVNVIYTIVSDKLHFVIQLYCLRTESADFWSLKGKVINTGLSISSIQLGSDLGRLEISWKWIFIMFLYRYSLFKDLPIFTSSLPS